MGLSHEVRATSDPRSANTDNAAPPTLGPFSMTTPGLGAIIGAGNLREDGTRRRKFAGPGVVISMLIAGSAAPSGLCYAEFARMTSSPGSA